MENSAKKLVLSIIRQRKYLLKTDSSGKSKTLCVKYIQELTMQIEAYQSKWNESGWNAFLKRNVNKLEYLVPNNKSGQTIIKKLYAIQ